jgi:tetratricopeptide (TPR) repeat protein
LHHARWLATGSSSARQAFADTVEQLVRHHPHSSPLRRNLGDWYLQAYRQLGDAAALRQAVEAYQEAVERYPNHSFARAQLAWALHLAGEQEQASAAAAEALRLDELNPHQEQKLAVRSLFDPGPSAMLLDPTAEPTEPTEPTAMTDRASNPAPERTTTSPVTPSTSQPPRPSGHAELICHQLRSSH